MERETDRARQKAEREANYLRFQSEAEITRLEREAERDRSMAARERFALESQLRTTAAFDSYFPSTAPHQPR